jgi:hypothetical protein
MKTWLAWELFRSLPVSFVVLASNGYYLLMALHLPGVPLSRVLTLQLKLC